MNWRRLGKTAIKLSNLTNSVYNATSNGGELKKVASKYVLSRQKRWSRDHASHVRQGTQGMLPREHVSL